METWFVPNTPCELPPARRVLVLAPHPDDEVFGCGGSVALYANASAEVRILVLSDGGGYLEGEERAAQVDIRRQESRRAADLLGARGIDFGPWQDRCLTSAHDLAERIGEAIRQTGAEMVFAPSLWEAHPDHRATAWAALRAQSALARDAAAAPRLAFYEVSLPQRPNCLVDITPVLAQKRSAMALFQSELAKQPYDRHIAALNTYRAYSLPGTVEAAEALAIVAPEEASAWLASFDEVALPGLLQVNEAALARATVWGESLQQATARLDHAVRALSAALERERGERIALEGRIESERLQHQEQIQAHLDAFAAERRERLDAFEAERHAFRQDIQAREIAFGVEQRRLIEQIQARKYALDELLASRSWRFTAPIRSLAEGMRQLISR